MRIQDFHRGGLVKPEHSGRMRPYGTLEVTVRQKHGTGYIEGSLTTGEMTKVRTHNSTVKLDNLCSKVSGLSRLTIVELR
jgi:hypothetical protein